MKRKLTAGQTGVSLPIFVQATNSTTGGGLASLTHSTAGLVAEYRRRGQSSWTAITLASKTLGTWTSGGFVADGSLSGAYEIDLPDAVCAANARWVAVRLYGAANMLPVLIEIELDQFDYEKATQPVNLSQILGTALTESTGGWLAAAFKKLFDVATPVFTLASVNQTGDSFARLGAPVGASVSADLLTLLNRLTSTRAGLLDNLDVAISVIQSQISAQNNLSAKCNWFGSMLLEIPDSGTRAYVFELVVRDDEDKLVSLDASPTIALVNSAGTDRSSLITTTIANPATGRYTLTITVGTSTTTESLKLTATGTVSGETRYAVLMTQVVDYDSATLINSIYTRLGAPAGASIAADIADLPTVAEFEARSIAAASYATASALSSLAARVPAALVDGRMDCSVGAMASAVLTAAAIASGAFNGKGDWRTALTLKGSLTETQVMNLMMAALAGVTSQPSGTTEKFKHLDGTDAFTTTLDSNGNRTNVAIA